MPKTQTDFICFGEILWDLLPSGKLPGGAPMNVAYHLHTLGNTVQMISKIGDDDLGKALLKILQERHIATNLVQTDNTYPTGVVKVTLDKAGSPSYEITQPVAWDFIASSGLKEIVDRSTVFIYGSLAARNTVSSNTLLGLLNTTATKVMDVNLRTPFYAKLALAPLLQAADIIKMNEEELDIIAGWYDLGDHSMIEQLYHLQVRFGWEGILLTKGTEGALFYSDKTLYQQAIFPVTVADTIGSGDAFLAGFLHQYIKKQPIRDCLRLAAYMGAFVASHKGAMPSYEANEILKQIDK